MTVDSDMTTELSVHTARPLRADARDIEPQRRSGRSSAMREGVVVTGAIDFNDTLDKMRSDAGAALGLRSVDRELNGKMFDAPPTDAGSVRAEQAREETRSRDPRDPKALRMESIDGRNVTNQVAAAGVFDQSIQSGIGNKAPSAGASANGHQNVPNPGGVAFNNPTSIENGTGVAQDASASRSTSALEPGAVPTQLANAGATTSSGTTPQVVSPVSQNTRSSGSTTSAADQLAKAIQSKSGIDGATARAITATDSGASKTGQSDVTDRRLDLNPKLTRDASSTTKSSDARPAEPTPFDDLIRSIRLRTQPHLSTARIRLDPPELGQVRVDVRMTGERLEFNVETETEEAARIVRGRVNELTAALEQKGIRVEAASVQVQSVDAPHTPPWSHVAGFAYSGASDRNDGSNHAGSGSSSESAATGEPVADDGWMPVNPSAFGLGSTELSAPSRRVDVRV